MRSISVWFGQPTITLNTRCCSFGATEGTWLSARWELFEAGCVTGSVPGHSQSALTCYWQLPAGRQAGRDIETPLG